MIEQEEQGFYPQGLVTTFLDEFYQTRKDDIDNFAFVLRLSADYDVKSIDFTP